MPRRSEEAYTITYAVLGFLARWGATSGYDLKLRFERGMGHIWEATHSQIYNELRRLQRNGWADMEKQEQETRPDRKVYHITDAGRTALVRWLSKPVDMPRIHDELALKTMLGSFAPGDTLVQTLRAAAKGHENRLSELHLEIREHGSLQESALWQESGQADNRRDAYVALVVRLGVQFEEMYLRWLNDAIQQLEAHRKEG